MSTGVEFMLTAVVILISTTAVDCVVPASLPPVIKSADLPTPCGRSSGRGDVDQELRGSASAEDTECKRGWAE